MRKYGIKNQMNMRKNYRFEILSILYHNADKAFDILPLIESMAEENIFSRLYFNIVLQSLRDSELISYTDYGDEIKAVLQPKGIEEYQRLKKHAVAYGTQQNNK